MSELVKHARYLPTSKAICPVCWSDLSWKERIERENSAQKGWGTVATGETLRVDAHTYPVVTTLYPCANVACAIPVCTTWLSGAVGKFAVAPFLKEHVLAPKDLDTYDHGSVTKAGVWMDAYGTPKDLPPPVIRPPKKTRGPRKNAAKKTTRRRSRT